ncbi:TetR/AcrR family transcriptional regulator [Rhodococcoides corynebacterioides]|uniref:TetR/AcrR family transcriptional regulator n=1 Tax=Rhodococcoides corynebacterioides TaxID=53972 RepID=A0ABS7P424_9NOCA|nr:TetR/AcrR family transcriptional regulator [Rhodococcus corynebacterioides]MBY6367171.1 TetR/AcrR family transcriptional regulator [Rhodococcus corynebacterioides]MBY6407415.1 TetR/AcrR family transcriptional regulator [Rhodococcus corynebacterioides]
MASRSGPRNAAGERNDGGETASVDGAGKPDGRKRRWREHKIARREELVDGTLAAIRARGRSIGMDEIATEIGISKTVLYRYFTDKNDLTNATLERYVETTLAPRIYEAIAVDVDEYNLTRRVVTAYVETVAEDPEVYLYAMSTSSGPNRDVVAESERMIAELLSTVLGERLRRMDMDSGGSLPWAYGIVGGVQLATHWWISNRSMSATDLIDYLTMMVWGGIHGVAEAGGSPARFNSVDHPLVDGT